MDWHKHSDLIGKHAFLSPSKHYWINDTPDKLRDRYSNYLAVKRGTELHAYAAKAIELNRRQPKNADTVNHYINDALGFRMNAETPLFYSHNCFGTADAISFNKKLLRVHDLKTGTTPASRAQLDIYAALFCLEYGVDPTEISMVNRIYQSNDIDEWEPDSDYILDLMNVIVESDAIVKEMQEL